MKTENKNSDNSTKDNVSNCDKAIEWFKSLPHLKARSLAINHTNRFIREPFRELSEIEIQEIWSQNRD